MRAKCVKIRQRKDKFGKQNLLIICTEVKREIWHFVLEECDFSRDADVRVIDCINIMQRLT